jgi:predicted O-methyltransferase YrrM
MHTLKGGIKFWRTFGGAETGYYLCAEAGNILAAAGRRRLSRPTLDDFGRLTDHLHFRADQLAPGLPPPWAPRDPSAVLDEFNELWHELMPLCESLGPASYPDYFAVSRESALLLYSVVRSRRPGVVLESGVANGVSTWLILKALDTNGQGRLISTDVSDDVGSLLAGLRCTNWDLNILRPETIKADFLRVLKKAGEVDLFLHDSDHRYCWQKWELASVRPFLAAGALILADDIDDSFAFFDFVREAHLPAWILVDRTKVFGVAAP